MDQVIATIPVYYFQKELKWTLLFTVVLNVVIMLALSVAVTLLLPYTVHLHHLEGISGIVAPY